MERVLLGARQRREIAPKLLVLNGNLLGAASGAISLTEQQENSREK
jgi:hypothetical protein